MKSRQTQLLTSHFSLPFPSPLQQKKTSSFYLVFILFCFAKRTEITRYFPKPFPSKTMDELNMDPIYRT